MSALSAAPNATPTTLHAVTIAVDSTRSHHTYIVGSLDDEIEYLSPTLDVEFVSGDTKASRTMALVLRLSNAHRNQVLSKAEYELCKKALLSPLQ